MKDLGNLSAVDPPYGRRMWCDACEVTWIGCWDSYLCPQCDEGDLPWWKEEKWEEEKWEEEIENEEQ